MHAAFSHILGHETAREMLSRALTGGRLSHAYLFVGSEGIGKSTVALALFAAFFDVKPSALFSHPDFIQLACLSDEKTGKEKSQISIEQIREVVERISLTSFTNKKGVWIEEADHLNISAANALLKTLEEPSGSVLFILRAEHEESIPATLASRCQIIRFHPLPLSKRFKQPTVEQLALKKEAAGLFRAGIPVRMRWASESLPKEEVNKASVALERLGILEEAAREEMLRALVDGQPVRAWVHTLDTIAESRDAVRRNGNPQLALEHTLLSFSL